MLYEQHPIVSMGVIYFVNIFRVIYRYLFGTVWGVLFLAIMMYYNSEFLLGTTPISFNELCLLLFSLSETMKAAIVSSLITIIGFIVAYATASSNWKAQLQGTLKSEASFECVNFFDNTQKKVMDCFLYAESLKATIEKIQAGKPKEELLFHTKYDREKTKEFIANREAVVLAGINSHTFLAKYNPIIVNTNGVAANLNLAISALSQISDDIWFNVPYEVSDSEKQISSFMKQVDITSLNKFIATVNVNKKALSFHPGAVAGILMDPVVKTNWSTLITLFKVRGILWDQMSDIHSKKKG